MRPLLHSTSLTGAAVLHGGGQLLDIHQHRGIAAHAHHQVLRMRDLGADGGRQSIAHGARPARAQPATGPALAQMLGGPHLVLAHIGGHDGVAAGQARIEPAHQGLRQDEVGTVLEVQAALGAPAGNARPPGRKILHPAQTAAQGPKAGAAVAQQGHLGAAHLADGARIDVQMDDFGIGAEALQPTRDPVIEARAHADHQIEPRAWPDWPPACRACPACPGTAHPRPDRRPDPSASACRARDRPAPGP